MKWSNKITELLNIDFPIVQAPMFGVTTPDMVAATSNIACLGSLALGDLDANKSVEVIRKTKQLTNKPFAVNIFVHDIPEITNTLKTKYTKSKNFIEQFACQNNLHVNLPTIDELTINSYHEQIEAIISENCKIVSFTFGNLDQQSIDKLKHNGTILIGTCTSIEEAIVLENSGIDIICVQGLEAGGHRGSFVTDQIPKIGGLSLLSKVNETVKVPIIYAGGIYDGKTLLATKILGANGFQIGSLLLGSTESGLQDFEKKRLRKVKENEIVLTKSFSGRFARGIKNTYISEIENTEYILPYPYQNKLTNELRKIAKLNKNTEFLSIWVGQSINEFSDNSTAQIIKNLIKQTETINSKSAL